MMLKLRLWIILVQLLLWVSPAFAYQVQLNQKNTPYRTEPGLRKGKVLGRLSPQNLTFLNHIYAEDGELWCLLKLQNGKEGWVQSRFLNPSLKDNIPMSLVDFPSALVFERAQMDLIRSNVNSNVFKAHLQKALVEIDLAMIKQRWESLHNRLNFLDISRRVGVTVSAAEFQSLKQEMSVLEKRFQVKLSELQRLL